MKKSSILTWAALCCAAFSNSERLAAANGDLDPGFGTGGKVIDLAPGGNESGQAIARQVDGKLVVAGGANDDFFVARYNADGTLDNAFGSGGRVFTDFSGGVDEARAVALQSDGKIVVGGVASFDGSSDDFAVARYNSDGSPDASFGAGGLVHSTFPDAVDEINALLIQPDGKIVACGSTENFSDGATKFAVARYNPDGSLDPTFGSGGLVSTKVGTFVDFDVAFGIAIQADGKLVVVGGVPPNQANGSEVCGFARYNPDGSLDSSFGNGGTYIPPLIVNDGNPESLISFLGRGVAIQADGRIVAAGWGFRNKSGPRRDFIVLRINSDGSLDTSFGLGGRTLTDFNAGDDIGNAIALRPDGKIVVAGAVDVSGDGGLYRSIVGVTRYNSDGTPDTGFGAGGKSQVAFQDLFQMSDIPFRPIYDVATAARALVLQPDGSVVTAGSASLPGTRRDIALTRLDANGAIDNGFGDAGKVFTDLGLVQHIDTIFSARPFVIQPDGKILITSGLLNYLGFPIDGAQFSLVRYNADGSLDTAFGVGGRAGVSFNDSDGFLPAAASSLALQPDGKIVVAGLVITTTLDGVALARFNSDGTVDNSFGTNGTSISAFDLGAKPTRLAIDQDGKFIVAGTGPGSSGSDLLLARFNPDGNPDSSFGSGGQVSTDFFDIAGARFDEDICTGLALDPNGRIVIAGEVGSDRFALARYNPDGTLDGSFGTGGRTLAGEQVKTGGIALQNDGKLIVTGSFDNGSDDDLVVARFNSDGSLDSSFGLGGITTNDFGAAENGSAVALDPNGRIVIGGSSEGTSFSDFLVAVYLSNGALDSSFGSGGKVTTDFLGHDDEVNTVALASDGNILAGGAVEDSTFGGHVGLAKYQLSASAPASGQLLNIATRLRVQTGENVLIGGLIITGTDPKKVIIRGIGPSLASFFSGALANPTLELYQGSTLLDTNDDWTERRAEIEATGIPPTNELESAIVRTLAPGNYTAVLRGKDDTAGIGLVEAYDLDQAANSKLGNIATRGFVEGDNNVMIGGLIVGPAEAVSAKVVVRAIGPSLSNFQINGALQDPTLDFVDANGVVIRSNNDWQQGGQDAELIALSLQPGDAREAALIETVGPGNYTAVVRGAGNTTGVGLVEVYNVP